MKKQGNEGRKLLKPSPNEEANILQNEREKRKKQRLKQIREQEKAFSRKVLKDARKRQNIELKELTCHLKDQWKIAQEKRKSDLEKKYQENAADFGLGHRTASEDQTNYSKPEMTKEERQRALERYEKAVEQLMYERAKMTQSERERTKARQLALKIERQRAARVAALPPTVDPLKDLSQEKDQPPSDKKKFDNYSTSRFHLKPTVLVERDMDPSQEDAREAAKDEEEKIRIIMEEVQRGKAEQTEKARLRHKHALAQLQLEEDHKRLMEELDSLERCDRQRRQEAVARIPVRIFQPPHKRLEDAEDRQRDLEQAFEDMYMMHTDYTGDLTVALEPPEHLRPASADSLLSESDQGSAESVGAKKPPQPPDAVVPDESSEGVGHGAEPEAGPEIAPSGHGAPKGPSEGVPPADPLRRLLKRIERQRDQWKERQPPEGRQPPSAAETGIPQSAAATVLPQRTQEFRIPDTIPFSTTPEQFPEAEFSGEEEATETGKFDEAEMETGQPRPEIGHELDRVNPPASGARTLLHPLEAAQRSRTTTTMPTAQLSQQEALLEQQKLKLQLQQQNLLQQQLEQQLQDYQRQLADIYGHVDMDEGLSVPDQRSTLEEPFTHSPPYDSDPFLTNTTLEGVEDTEGKSFHVQASHNSVPQTEGPKSPSTGGSPLLSDALESSTLGSVTSDESGMSSDLRRTLQAAHLTAEKAAHFRTTERDILKKPDQGHLDDFPSNGGQMYLGTDTVSGGASSPQSEELVNVSTPSTLSLSVTLSSDLSVTAAASHTSHTGHVLLDTRGVFPPTFQGWSRYSDIRDTTRIAAATSLLNKTKASQGIGFSQPSSASVQQFSVLSSRTEPSTHFSRAVAPPVLSSGLATNIPGTLPSAIVTSSSSIESTTPKMSAFQHTQSGYSPGYVDFYQQKMEEEQQLFETQRNRVQRHSDLCKKTNPGGLGSDTYQDGGSASKSAPPIKPFTKTSPSLWEKPVRAHTYLGRNTGYTNKENVGFRANSSAFMGQDRLQAISERLGAFEKTMTTAANSAVVTSSSYSQKPLSTSREWSHGSGTEYLSLPHESEGQDARGSIGSTFSTLSELTEMMTRLTSTSDESESTSSKAQGASGALEVHSFSTHGRQVGYVPGRASIKGPGSSISQPSLTTFERNINLRGLSGEGRSASSTVSTLATTAPLNSALTRVAFEKRTTSSGTVEQPLNSQGSRLTRGSDGKQWFVLSRSHTLSSGGGMLEKDGGIPEEGGADNVFSDANEGKSHLLCGAETGSVASISSGSLSSTTMHSGTTEEPNETSPTNSEPQGPTHSMVFSTSLETPGDSSP
ncbi:uncharacterized protein LOC111329743 isoform X2 [Stylophora pistillata]|uniref:Centrosomal protein KIAA1731-like protein n=1 Tax=Stylophora pistillata TaxID=50429 RepID=A0A2B4S9Y2_STYPI|nr:uncharacterized protein LOC111329743 isoform X2 [Stylophora pistillata]PFX25843.1 Centrosomal protein KIAA1731-like protein [Stylophora pistillata]